MVYCDQNKCYIRVGELLHYKVGEEEFHSRLTDIQMRVRYGPGIMMLGIREPEFFTELHGEQSILSEQLTSVDGVKYVHNPIKL
jgi:hypothetical protein